MGKIKSDARAFIARYMEEPDGSVFDGWPEDIEDACETHVSKPDKDRWEFRDGSSIVACGDCWDFGIHNELLDVAQTWLDAFCSSDQVERAGEFERDADYVFAELASEHMIIDFEKGL